MLRYLLKRKVFYPSSIVRTFDGVKAVISSTDATGKLTWFPPLGLSLWSGQRSCSGAAVERDSSSETSDVELESVRPRNDNSASLLRSLNAYEFRQHVNELSTTCSQITYEEFLQLAQDQGAAATSKESRDLCDTLIASGVFFRYGNVVYLNPNEIADVVKSSLPDSVAKTRQLVNELERELEPLEKEKCELEGRATRVSDRLLQAGLFFLVAQFGLLLRLTFWDLSWDVMEPAVYFLTLGYGIGFYVYFLYMKEDYQHTSVHDNVKGYYLRKAKTFDASKYERLRKKLMTHSRFLAKYAR